MLSASRCASVLLIPALLILPAAFAGPPQVPGPPAAEEKPFQALPYTPSLDLRSLDRSINPCVDFYQFACGGWEKNNPIPGDQAGWDVYNKLANENVRFLWGLLEEAATVSNPSPAQKKIGDYFASCMDEAAVDAKGTAPLKPVLDQIEAVPDIQALGKLWARLQSEGYGLAPFGFASNQDFADATQVIAFATAGGLGLADRDQYLKDDPRSKEIRSKYAAYAGRMFELFGDAPDKAAARAQTVLVIETELAKATLTRVEERDPKNLDHKMTTAQLAELAPKVDWNGFLAGIGTPPIKALNVTQPAFLKKLNELLGQRSLADWKIYLRWRAINSSAAFLSSKVAATAFDFYGKTLRGQKEQPKRWKRCVRWVDQDLGEALGQVFVAKTFSPATKQATLDMARQVINAMEGEIKQLDWMGPETKQRALLKLHAIVNKIGYPDKWRDYSSLTIQRGDFFGNVMRSSAFENRRQLAKIGKPLDRGEWSMTPPTVNAYFDPQMNDMNFPAGVLQPPLYDPKLDDAPNFGNTAATIGHELTHGFDDSGRQFDHQGNLKDWWTDQDAKAFEARCQCVIDQYAQYTVVDDIKINSKLSVGEDVADLGGTYLGYLAWKSATRGKDLKPIDGFSPDQRFFIGMAQWACNIERPENMRLRAITDPHSPGRYRINGVVSNMPEFAAAFQCQAGQPMVREKPCKVW